MPLKHRLNQLADRARRAGYATDGSCPACRHRRGINVLVTAREDPDGAVVAVEDGLEPCVACGQIPETVTHIVEVVVESREDLLNRGEPSCR